MDRAHKIVDIRRNDNVRVITGRDKGKEGRVLRVMPREGKVLVEHVMMVKKNVRPNPQRNIKGGIAEQESPVSTSNVIGGWPSWRQSRIGHKLHGSRHVRICRRCEAPLDK